jgi:hypothetical protein
MMRYTLVQLVFLYDTPNMVLLESARKNFVMKEFPTDKTVHNLVNKLRTGLFIDKKQKHKCWEFTEEKLDETGVRF